MTTFEKINKGYNNIFKAGELSIGVVIPIENYSQSTVPTMQNHLQKVKLVEKLGFKAIWVRDVPVHVPTFGDAGQTFDPFTYLGFLAGQTSEITIGVASIALPLHHPIHVFKSATTLDQLSSGRMILGVASGDRPEEYPAMNIKFDERGELFRNAFEYIRKAQKDFPLLDDNMYGNLNGQVDVIPKASGSRVPLMVTGSSRQPLEWIAKNGDGWMYYPRNLYMQEHNIKDWRKIITDTQEYNKPFMQPLYIDLHEDNDFKPVGIHLGFRMGMSYVIDYFQQLKNLGVNHIGINLRFNNANTEETLQRLAEELLPHFHSKTKENNS